jgi:hypothetical protein
MDLGTPTHLVTFDSAGNVTDLGPSVASIDGIAFSVAVPEPATWAILSFAAVICSVFRFAKHRKVRAC